MAAAWSMFADWVLPLDQARMDEVLASWPGPVTWIFPASAKAPPGICRGDGTVALRVTAHPGVVALSQAFSGAIVSTSANKRGQAPCVQQSEVFTLWPGENIACTTGHVGYGVSVSQMRDACSGAILRP